MLEYIREKMRGVFAAVVVGIFCAVFALWGVEQLFNVSSHSNAVAIVNGEDITAPALENAIQSLRQQYMKMLGGQVDASFLNDNMLRKPAMETLISRMLLQEEAKKIGITANNNSVDQLIVKDPVFSRDGKHFDPEYYKERLRGFGVTAAIYKQGMREQISLGQLRSGIAETAFVTPLEIKRVAQLEAQKRSFVYVKFPLRQYEESVVVNDESITKYYNDHQNDFMSDETVVLEYVELSKDALAKTIKMDEAEVRASYDKEAAAFQPVTERKAAHILIDINDDSYKEKLEKIAVRLQKGDDFSVLAKEYSSDEGSAAHGGDVGFTSGNVFAPEFEKALAGLASVGEVSKPVKTEFGYHVIKLLEKHQTSMKPYEQRKAELDAELRNSKADILFSEKMSLLGESAYSANDLNAPAQELGLVVQKTEPFTRSGGVGLSNQRKVLDASFSPDLLDSGHNSDVIELGADRAVVVRVLEHKLPKVRALADVKASITEKLKHQQAAANLDQKTEKLKGDLLKGETLEEIAAKEKLKDVTVAAKTRTAGGEEMEFLSAVFAMPKPSAGQKQAAVYPLKNGDRVLVHLISVSDSHITPDSAEYKTAATRLSQGVGEGDFAAYERQLVSKAEITRLDDKKPADAP